MTRVLGRQKFAVVEDDPFMADVVGEMLSCGDIDVEIFALGAELFDSPNLMDFEAIVLDLTLPDMGGFDVMDKLADMSSSSSILVTSGHDPATLAAAKIYGRGIGLKVRGVLTKPFSRAELLAALGLPA